MGGSWKPVRRVPYNSSERKAREALLAGIAAYFRALNDDEEETA
jgi:hypothetical protein